MTLSNSAEKEITKAIYRNRGLWKISVSVRLPEARQKIDKALLRNSELSTDK
ncbi:unnamed protein product [Soboliphyme baturini]|uniref:Transposase n=1 Tax=Soboliphyme baturini TaxID=241478 RepID=A0A183J861_9BILA|nr:unnamed protein product [Soboliphyme baturini]